MMCHFHSSELDDDRLEGVKVVTTGRGEPRS